jgi:hypothetical protein
MNLSNPVILRLSEAKPKNLTCMRPVGEVLLLRSTQAQEDGIVFIDVSP